MSFASVLMYSVVRALTATAYFAAKRRANDAPSPGPTPIIAATGLDSDSGIFHSPLSGEKKH
jgi:hypothetical protein